MGGVTLHGSPVLGEKLAPVVQSLGKSVGRVGGVVGVEGVLLEEEEEPPLE